MEIAEICSIINQKIGAEVSQARDACSLQVSAKDWLAVATELLHNDVFWFDHLSFLTAVDLHPEGFELVIQLYSIPHDRHLRLYTQVPRDRAEIQSLTSLWRSADWHERETYDLFGIHFIAHADLRRILMPADWEGFPLRKDYVQQESYHGIALKWQAPDEQNNGF